MFLLEVIIIVSIVLGVIIVISFIFDLIQGRIPNLIIIAGFAFWFIYTIWMSGAVGILNSLISVIIMGTFLFIIYLIGGIGAGDVKLICLLVSFLSLRDSMKFVILALFAGAFCGCIKLMLNLSERISKGNNGKGKVTIKFTGPIFVSYLLMLFSKGGII